MDVRPSDAVRVLDPLSLPPTLASLAPLHARCVGLSTLTHPELQASRV
jgi:hypothetical protein